jgi:hypothetical protein
MTLARAVLLKNRHIRDKAEKIANPTAVTFSAWVTV